jgi:hypothetical protein
VNINELIEDNLLGDKRLFDRRIRHSLKTGLQGSCRISVCYFAARKHFFKYFAKHPTQIGAGPDWVQPRNTNWG